MANTFDATQVQAWVHNLDPFLIQFSETFGIRWYGLAYMFGFISGALIMAFLSKRGRRTLPTEQITDFITYVVLGTMIGGRLGYAIFYSPDLLTDFSAKFPFWGVLAVWEGGMASHGGIIGVILASALYAKRHKVNWLHLGDLTTLGGGIGIFCGRVANFINGELAGRTVQSNISWAVKFPSDLYRWIGSERARLSGLTDVVKDFNVTPETWTQWLHQIAAGGGTGGSASSAARAQISATLEQVIAAVQSGNAAVAAKLQPFLEARHPSQLYEALLEGLLLFVVCLIAWRKPRKPGVIGGIFLTTYSLVRIFGEQFRMPDAHIGFEVFGLTRGQILSIFMFFASATFLWWAARRPVDRIGGWGPEAMALKSLEEKVK